MITGAAVVADGVGLSARVPSGDTGAVFVGVNPVTGEELAPRFTTATPEEIDKSVAAAVEAFPEFGWSSRAVRAGLLEAIAGEMESTGESIVERAHLETGLPLARLQGELGRTTGQLRLFAGVAHEGRWAQPRIDDGDPDRVPSPKPDVRSMLRPLGPVVVFGASNFPLAFSTAGGDTASALAAGNPVLVKGHPAHPGTSELVAQAVVAAVQSCGLPAGVFCLLQDRGIGVGTRLVSHPDVQAVGFTGSLGAGRALMDLAAARPVPIPVFAEMGSVNPIFLLPSGLRGNPTPIADAVRVGAGQFCTRPGVLVYVDAPEAEPFIAGLESGILKGTAGHFVSDRVAFVYRAAVKLRDGMAMAKSEHRSGNAPTDQEASTCAAEPVLFRCDADTFVARPDLRSEIFGPTTLLVRCRDDGEMLEVARCLEGQLAIVVHGDESEVAERAELWRILQTKAGRVLCGGVPTGIELAHATTHGGPYPATSDGRSTSLGSAAIERFSRRVAFQNVPQSLLPVELQDATGDSGWRLRNGR